ncbi:MAG: Uma2 family endonuclease [Planctomycetes bacterium]|nr:Uma2 family endonuclease [Planctomycetota bacterium]
MSTFVTDLGISPRLMAERRARGNDSHDEIWEGVYVMTPAPNNEHQELVFEIGYVLREVVKIAQLGIVLPGTNVTDRRDDWTKNYRCPDVVVFLNDTQAENRETHWIGGPDLAVEIVSPGDQSREKIAFYEKVGTRELLIVDRDPWQLELHRLVDKKLVLVGTSTLADPVWLTSETVPLKLRLQPGKKRPQIELQHTTDEKTWRL